jgi:hypothetical protein
MQMKSLIAKHWAANVNDNRKLTTCDYRILTTQSLRNWRAMGEHPVQLFPGAGETEGAVGDWSSIQGEKKDEKSIVGWFCMCCDGVRCDRGGWAKVSPPKENGPI